MYCCERCFSSETLKEEIRHNGVDGKCDLCGENAERCVRALDLRGLFEKLIGSYGRPYQRMPGDGLGESEPDSLAAVMQADGLTIFAENLSAKKRNAFLTRVIMLPGVTATEVWTSPFASLHLFSSSGWKAFQREVREQHRYVVRSRTLDLLRQASDANSG